MMTTGQYPSAQFEKAVTEIAKLPGIGGKTAMRLALHLLRQDVNEVRGLAHALTTLREEVKYCQVCHNISDTETCSICGNPRRDKSMVCVVENIQDVMAIEQTHQYNGLYHVLGGIISPMDGTGPSDLEIDSLIDRLQNTEIKEVIMALNPNMEGDTTSFYIVRRIPRQDLEISTIARGIAQNDELQYTDEITLGRSIVGRIPFKS